MAYRRYFNSHPHEEDDDSVDTIPISEMNISTHILTKRMTAQMKQNQPQEVYFNSHPHEEDDLSML